MAIKAQPIMVKSTQGLARDLQGLLGAAENLTGSALEASESTAKRMAQANLSSFGKEILALDSVLDNNSDYRAAQDKADEIYSHYKNADVGTSQDTYDEMFDKSALMTVGRTKGAYGKKAVVQETTKLLNAKEQELMFTGSVDSDYLQTWKGDVTASGLVTDKEAHTAFSDIQITKFNNRRNEFAGLNLNDDNVMKGFNLMFGSQTRMTRDSEGNIAYEAVGSTPSSVVDNQRKAYEKFLKDVGAKRNAEVKQSLKKPDMSLHVGSANAEALYTNQKQYLDSIKLKNQEGLVSVTDKQISEQEVYVEKLKYKTAIVNGIVDNANNFLDGTMTYEDATKPSTISFKLDNGQMYQQDVTTSDYMFYINKTITDNESVLRDPTTTKDDRSTIVAGLVRIEGDSQGRVKSKFLVNNEKQTINGSNTEVKSLADMSGRLQMTLDYRTLSGANEMDSWVNDITVNALDVEIGQLNARVDLTEAEKVTLIKHSIEVKKTEYQSRKVISAEFTAYLKDAGDDIYSWKLGEQRFASGTLPILHKRLNSSLEGTTNFDSYIKTNTMILEHTPAYTWIPFVGGDIEGIVILKPEGSPDSDKVIMEKIVFDAQEQVGDTVAADNIHNHRWGFGNTLRDGHSALTVTIFDASGTSVYERTYIGKELAQGMTPEQVRKDKDANEAALMKTIKER